MRLWLSLLSLTVVIVVSLLTLPVISPGVAAQTSDAELVAQFVPANVTEYTERNLEETGFLLPLDTAFAAVDLDGTGTEEYLAAVYSNGYAAGITLLKKQGGSAILVAQPEGLAITGTFGTVGLNDLDNDGTPEILISMHFPAHTVVWPFRWANDSLDLIAPTRTRSSGAIASSFVDTVFWDIDGDGVKEALNPSIESEDDPGTVYTWSNGTYEPTSDQLLFWASFVRDSGTPELSRAGFGVADPQGIYTLRIRNGDATGANRVSSAEVRLNGGLVVASNQVNQQVEELVVPVSLQTENVFDVRLTAQPYGYIFVLVEPPQQ